jgi:alpha-beta hydrolase superfamily lysophospholipase
MVTRTIIRYLWIIGRASAAVIATIVLLLAFNARKLPDLHVWHQLHFDNEFDAKRDRDVNTLADYLARERAVFDELRDKVHAEVVTGPNVGASRFRANSIFNSRNHEKDWNRTTELIPDNPIGVALMLHGLTDSPYSMRSTAEFFFEQGFHVLVPRLPGHGTAPAGIRQVHWEDWQAVVSIGVNHLRSDENSSLPFVIVGYSNGGALALNYVLDALDDDTLPMPDNLILMSPAIGLTPFAFFASWNRALSWIPYFQKFAWESVLPEYDPYKYNSFPMAAGNETFELAQHVQKRLKRLATVGDVAGIPPIVTFVPLADATVKTPATVDFLYSRLNRPQDELVVYDINRLRELAPFFGSASKELLPGLQKDTNHRYRLTVVGNQSQDTLQVNATSRQGSRSSVTAIDSQWPANIFSLSHVSVPFPMNDEWYGDGLSQAAGHVSLGALIARSEKNLLVVSPAQILRLRYNPFHDYQVQRIAELLAELQVPADVKREERQRH